MIDAELGTWTTQDKRVLKIVEMEDSHLVSAWRWLRSRVAVLALKPVPRMVFARELYEDKMTAWSGKVAELQAEIERRKLLVQQEEQASG